ncbi:MAG: hypothetical protein E3J72_18465 [Planctomycetota bacterium]|nr:MAG: hypothetical protein E3J72_18465 [Planctomycetota bacterium]
MQSISLNRPHVVAACVFLFSIIGLSCNIKGFKEKPYPTPRVIVTTPSGVQQEDITLTYRLIEVDGTGSDISLEFSTDGGSTWSPGTAKGGDGTTNVKGMIYPGITRTIVWDSFGDGLSGTQTCKIKITAKKTVSGAIGAPGETRNFDIQNPDFPVISWIAKPEGTVRQVPLTFAWKLDTPSVPIANYYYGLDEDPPTSTTTGTSVTIPAPSFGPHDFRVYASSTAGLNSSVLTATFTCDNAAANQPPSVVILSGPSGATTDNTPTFEYLGGDPDGSVAGYFVSIDTNPPDIWTTQTLWTSTELTCGSHMFYVMAQDNENANSSVELCSFSVTTGLENNNGEFLWVRTIGTADDDYHRDTIIDANGNLYITGFFGFTGGGNANFAVDWGGSDIKVSHGWEDAFIMKVNSDGSYGWTRNFGGIDPDRGMALAYDSTGTLHVCGEARNEVNFQEGWGGYDNVTTIPGCYSFLMKIAPDGSYLETKMYGGHRATCIFIDNADNIYLAGNFFGNVNFAQPWGGNDFKNSSGNRDCFITRINNDGSYGWTRRVGDVWDDSISGIVMDANGDLLLRGAYPKTVNFAEDWGMTDERTAADADDSFLLKIDTDGNYIWTKTLWGMGWNYISGHTMDKDGNLYFVGHFGMNQIATVNFAADWGGTDNKSNYNFSADGFVMRINNDGSYGWTKMIGGPGEVMCSDVDIDPAGNIWIVGRFGGTINFAEDWGGNDSITSVSNDGFVLRISPTGSYGKANRTGAKCQFVNYHAITGELYLCGRYQEETVDFGAPWGTTEIRNRIGSIDMYILKVKGF